MSIACLLLLASLNLQVSGLTAGGTAQLAVSGATPNRLVVFAFSWFGPGPSTISAPRCGTIALDLSTPFAEFPPVRSDARGRAAISTPVPARARGVTLWFQAVDAASCCVSNGVSATVQ